MNIYYATVAWFDSIHEKEETSTMIVIADSYSEAISKIEADLDEIQNIEIELFVIGWDKINCIYIDDSASTYDMLKDRNDF